MELARIDEATIAVTDAYRQRDALAAIDGARWQPFLKAWMIPATTEAALSLATLTPLPADIAALIPKREERVYVDTGEWITRATPYAHQRSAVAAVMVHMARGGGYALLHDMGCGKTLTTLEVVSRLAREGLTRVLVVSPSAVVPVWEREAASFLDTPHEVALLLGTKSQRLRRLDALSGPLQLAVVNHESAWRLQRELIAWGPQMVVVDESQRIKGHATRQTKGITAIGSTARWRLILSGTPVTNSPLDVFAQYRFLDPSIFGDSFYAFRARYAVMETAYGAHGDFKRVVGYRNLDELMERVHRIAHRVTKAEALDLPETVDTVVPVTLGAETRRVYDDLRRESVAAFEAGEVSTTNVLTRILRLQQVAGGSVPMDDGEVVSLGTEKLDAVREVVEDAVSGGSKVVVFARFRAETDALAAAFGEACVTLTGDTPMDERGEVVSRFQEDEDVRVIVSQIQVGGTGITLTAADVMVFASLSYSYADYEQAKARVHRIGQERKVTYVHIVATDTVDEQIMDALATKRSIADVIVDRGKRVYG